MTKLDAGTVPSDAEHYRYLAGIIRNLDRRFRLERTSDKLLQLRLMHDHLVRESLNGRYRALLDRTSPTTAPVAMLDQALRAQSQFDYRFWVIRATGSLSRLSPSGAIQEYRYLARIVAAHYHTDVERPEDILRRLGEAVSLANPAA